MNKKIQKDVFNPETTKTYPKIDIHDILFMQMMPRPTSRGIIADRLMKLWTFAMGRGGSRIAVDIRLRKQMYDTDKARRTDSVIIIDCMCCVHKYMFVYNV